MDDLEVAAIERACTRLVVAYTHLVDSGRAADVAELFTENGVWRAGKAKYEGRDAIRKAFAHRQSLDRTSRHVCTNLAIDVVDADHATGLVYLTLYRFDGDGPRTPEPDLVGDYRDTFVRTADGWRFATREASVTFARDGSD